MIPPPSTSENNRKTSSDVFVCLVRFSVEVKPKTSDELIFVYFEPKIIFTMDCEGFVEYLNIKYSPFALIPRSMESVWIFSLTQNDCLFLVILFSFGLLVLCWVIVWARNLETIFGSFLCCSLCWPFIPTFSVLKLFSQCDPCFFLSACSAISDVLRLKISLVNSQPICLFVLSLFAHFIIYLIIQWYAALLKHNIIWIIILPDSIPCFRTLDVFQLNVWPNFCLAFSLRTVPPVFSSELCPLFGTTDVYFPPHRVVLCLHPLIYCTLILVLPRPASLDISLTASIPSQCCAGTESAVWRPSTE